MANDRLLLKCPGCGEFGLVAKFWGGGDWAVPDGELRDSFEEFLNKHAKDCLSQFGNSLNGEPGFRLVVESDSVPTPSPLTSDRENPPKADL